ncbi:MAG: hypothetical protein JO324_03680 [Candidatus Eremiobacteraeota bacterium]|nr:hypothetical protein [Candidatus Eremiobacteraeota bacterium]
MRRIFMTATAALASCGFGAVRAVAAVHYSPPPPGQIAQRLSAYFTGSAKDGRYEVVTSRKIVGHEDGKPAYQWYLTIYAPANGGYVQSWQSPGPRSALVSRVSRAHGADRYFPSQTLWIAGAARLMGGTPQQVIVKSREIGADCGSVSIAILFADPKHADMVGPAAVLSNPCDLDAQIQGDHLTLRGPYYSSSAPLCCPTNPRASATLRYRNGAWIESPRYFKLTLEQAPKIF